jgi:hypothetical protein
MRAWCRHRAARSNAPRGVGTFSANVFVPLEAFEWLGPGSRASQRARRPTPVLGTSVAERRQSGVPVRARPHCAQRNEGRPELVVGCVRLRTLGSQSETRSACGIREAEGCSESTGEMRQDSAARDPRQHPPTWPSRRCPVRALRAGVVNARRPRGRGVEAKRRALTAPSTARA